MYTEEEQGIPWEQYYYCIRIKNYVKQLLQKWRLRAYIHVLMDYHIMFSYQLAFGTYICIICNNVLITKYQSHSKKMEG